MSEYINTYPWYLSLRRLGFNYDIGTKNWVIKGNGVYATITYKYIYVDIDGEKLYFTTHEELSKILEDRKGV